MSLFLVKMPKYEKKEDRERQQQHDIKSLIEGMEQIFSHFLYLKKPSLFDKIFLGVKPPRIALEIASMVGGEDISFYIAVPEYMASSAEKSIQGVYPDAVVEKVVQDYTVFEANGVVTAATMMLRKSFFYPIKTYKFLETDSLSVITNALSKIKPEEGSAIQIMFKPSSLDIKRKEEKILSDIVEKGKNPREAIDKARSKGLSGLISNMLLAILNFNSKTENTKEKQKQNEQQKERTANEAIIEGIKAKAQKSVFDVNIRLMAVGVDKIRSLEILGHLEGSFNQFSSSLNNFEPIRARK